MKSAILFPGQGAQYVGMGRSFYDQFILFRHTLEEAEDRLKLPLKEWIFEGDEEQLKETKISQPAIFVISMGIWRVLQKEYGVQAHYAGGLSLGEYSALVVAGGLTFEEALPIVHLRGALMHEACDRSRGTMSVIMGLSDEEVELLVKEINRPAELWAANFNCPGQVVLSGTLPAIKEAQERAKAAGAKRVMPLQVHGAFHSGLMAFARKKLASILMEAPLKSTHIPFAMNVPGRVVTDLEEIRQNLIAQVTESVRWHHCVRAMGEADRFIEVGPGKTLTGMNKRILPEKLSMNIDKVEDLKQLEER